MTFGQACVLFAAAIVAGAINSVAGGGSFISFPTLTITGVAEKIANATNTMALWPGSAASVGAYRRELVSAQRRILYPLVGVSLVGGTLGAVLLSDTPEITFKQMVPYLLLFATLLFTFSNPLMKWLRAHTTHHQSNGGSFSPRTLAGILTIQFVTAIYGGFFGGGIGIVMLATLQLMGMENIHEMNSLKTLLATCINGMAVFIFITKGLIVWPQAILMVIAAIIGGYGGAYYARKLDPRWVRRFVIGVGFTVTLILFARSR